jgi:hypothetical protein
MTTLNYYYHSVCLSYSINVSLSANIRKEIKQRHLIQVFMSVNLISKCVGNLSAGLRSNPRHAEWMSAIPQHKLAHSRYYG